ncbi:hypothetical protein AX762_11795 [Alkalibacterium sp. 20]|nr:hypothetical protein AX762_11795 [Alkalibacterium sp. 20]
MSKRKNQLTVCKAIEKLILENNIKYNIKYKIIGKVLDEKVFNLIKKYPFVEYIPFLSKEDLINEYRISDIFVMPSLTETFGLTYVEAMSQGLPIVYSKYQGIDGYFDDGIVGFGVNSMDINEISYCISKIMKDYVRFSNESTQNSLGFNWEDITERYQRMYNEIIYLNE